MATKIHWGILGTGNIAKKFAIGLTALPDAELVAVGSRKQETADTFGVQFNIPHSHANYEALAVDPDVDVVYIATPHPFHYENTLLCLDAGKAVLCEKPFAINAAQTRRMIDKAQEKKLFLMEAMWTRFLPIICKTRELIATGAIGEVQMLHADFGFRTHPNPESRLMNPALGGGGLLDVGIYPISLASMVFGDPPQVIQAMADLGKTGVDEQAVINFRYAGGKFAQLSCAIRTTTHHEASIFGTEGRIRLHAPWWRGTTLTLYTKPVPEGDNVIEMPFEGNGYNYEAAEVMTCLRAGKTESDTMPLNETLHLMETLDAIRGQWGLKYPMEEA
ncbi:MAG: Gfo/Idh/MocA family oxidoreductase [Anaerolineae bacterium]|nr:Gfo/Idh/MocA family oxidoreductase [Anaerolineae bacterium]